MKKSYHELSLDVLTHKDMPARLRWELLKELSRDLELQIGIIKDLTGHGRNHRSAPVEQKQRLLNCLKQKTEINRELLNEIDWAVIN